MAAIASKQLTIKPEGVFLTLVDNRPGREINVYYRCVQAVAVKIQFRE